MVWVSGLGHGFHMSARGPSAMPELNPRAYGWCVAAEVVGQHDRLREGVLHRLRARGAVKLPGPLRNKRSPRFNREEPSPRLS